MSTTEKEKICVSCEGRIAFDAEVCPYCATKQSGAQNSYQAPIFQNQSLEDSLTSLYTPPYQGKRPQFGQAETPEYEEEEEEPSMYKSVTEKPELNPLMGATVEETEEPQKSSLWPTAFLLGGTQITILGLMQLLFSKNGTLKLEWNANYWFFYLILGAPLLYFGYKKLKELNV